MKKTFLAVFFSLFILNSASAEIGVNVGVSAQLGTMEAKGKEHTSDTTNVDGSVGNQTSDTEETIFGTAGFFIEKDLSFLPGPFARLAVGFDNIAHDLDLGTQSNYRAASLGASGNAVEAMNHSLTAEVTGFQTVYATLNVTDWLYVKAGSVTVDIDTEYTQNGVKQTGYGNSHELDGTVLGIGVEKVADNGIFVRVEYNDYDIDGKKVANTKTDSKFSAELLDVSGSTGRISVGKSF
jgi:opacity protein-like surface antigen